jgi:hypothetical protein
MLIQQLINARLKFMYHRVIKLGALKILDLCDSH